MSEENWFSTAADSVGGFFEDAGDVLGDLFSSVAEGVTDLFSGGKVPEFLSGLVDGPDGNNAGQGYQYQAPGAAPEKTADKKGWEDTFKGFVSNNQKTLLELGFGAVAGMAKASAAKDAAKYKAEADSALLTKKDQLEQDANKRFSESVGGLNPVKPWKPKPLTRMDGSRVFAPTGLINSGVK